MYSLDGAFLRCIVVAYVMLLVLLYFVITVKPRTHDKQMLANMCLPTMLANKSLSCVQKVGQHFMLANKRETVRCDWLAIVNIMAAEWTYASCVDYTNYTSPFYLYIIHDCTRTDVGCLRFRLQAIKQITAAATSSSSAESAISAILLSNICWPTLFVVCPRL